MSYRKIHFGGQTYEYTIGRDVLKVKGVGVCNRAPDYAAMPPSIVREKIEAMLGIKTGT